MQEKPRQYNLDEVPTTDLGLVQDYVQQLRLKQQPKKPEDEEEDDDEGLMQLDLDIDEEKMVK